MSDYETLVRAAQGQQGGKDAAFEALIARFGGAAERWALASLGDPHLAQDAVQEAFITAYERIDQLQEAAAFPGWLRRIVLTQCHRVTRRKAFALAALDDETPDDSDPADEFEARETEDDVWRAVRALPDGERAVTEMFYVGGHSQQEIAERLRLPLTTVKKRLQYARERLRETVLPTMALAAGFDSPEVALEVTAALDSYLEDALIDAFAPRHAASLQARLVSNFTISMEYGS